MSVTSSPLQWHQLTVLFEALVVACFGEVLVCFEENCGSCPRKTPCCQLLWRRRREEAEVLMGENWILDDPGTCQEWEECPCSLCEEEGVEFQHQLMYAYVEGGRGRGREREREGRGRERERSNL